MRLLTILGLAVIAALLIIYIFQVSQAARFRFEISSYRSEVAQLFKENKGLETYYSQTNSLANLDPLLEECGYVGVDKVHYIQALEDAVAVR